MEFKINADKLTGATYKALDILFMMRPEKTSYGAIFGAVLVGTREAVCSLLSEKIASFVMLLRWYTIFFIGILVVRIDVIFYREPLDKEILGKLNSLKRVINESNLTDVEKRQMYRKLITSSIEKENSTSSDSIPDLVD